MKRKKLTHLFGIMALLLLTAGQSFAQNLRVHGRVLDELGEGLIGAGVIVLTEDMMKRLPQLRTRLSMIMLRALSM